MNIAGVTLDSDVLVLSKPFDTSLVASRKRYYRARSLRLLEPTGLQRFTRFA